MNAVPNAADSVARLAHDDPAYLDPAVKMEPLVCGWVAWSHLLSPAQAAMNVAFRYLPLLESFVATPSIHIAATKDPKMFGGPFVHLSAADVPRVRELIATTRQRFNRLLQLAAELKAFNTGLQEGSKGFSLNEFYARIPGSLAGMIELMYDIDNHPRICLLEELLYAEYREDLCKGAQEISLSAAGESERRFFMSTPRLRSPETLTITTSFSNPALDVLTSMRSSPLPLAELERCLGLKDLATSHAHLFTLQQPERNAADYTGDGVRIRYFGHACVLIQTAGTNILIDPMFASEPAGAGSCSRFTLTDLPDRIDYVILSHSHQDHFSPEMLLQIRGRVRKVVVPLNNRGSIADPSMKLTLAQLGFRDSVAIGHFDSIAFGDGEFVSLPFPGEHSDLDVYSKHSIFVRAKGRQLLFLVDSDGWDVALYQRIAKQILVGNESRIDALFLGMECHGAPLTWLYGPLLTKPVTRRDDESRRLNGSDFERARRIVQQFTCDRVYVYAMGQEPWLRYVMGLEYSPESVQLTQSAKLVDHCRSAGMISERLYGSQDILL